MVRNLERKATGFAVIRSANASVRVATIRSARSVRSLMTHAYPKNAIPAGGAGDSSDSASVNGRAPASSWASRAPVSTR